MTKSAKAVPPLRISGLPDRPDAALWADWVELLCLSNPDHLVSKSDVVDRASEIATARGVVAAEAEQDEVAVEDYEFPQPEQDEVEPVGSMRERQRRDRLVVRIDDAFRQLNYRQTVYGGAYPYRLGARNETLVGRQLTRSRRLYLYLLCASSSQWFTPPDHARKEFQDAFEKLSQYVVAAWLPKRMTVAPFGTAAGSDGKYAGTLAKKIRALASDVNATCLVTEASFRGTNAGDGGLDVVAWIPPLDTASGTLVVFAQATIEKDWPGKQDDISFDRWRNRLTLLCAPVRVILIPFCFRTSSGEWIVPDDIRSVVLDRQRIVKLLGSAGDGVVTSSALEIVALAASTSEGVA